MIAATPGREVADGPTRVDLVGAGLVLVLIVVGSTQIEPNAGERSVDALAVVCGAAGAVALAVWRRWIFVTVGIVLVAITIYLGRDYPGGPALLPGPLSLVALGYSAPRKVGLAGVVAFIVVTSTGHIVGGVELGLFQLVIVGWASAAVLAGQALAARSERAAAAREREEHRHEQALAAERLRIAQDLHDSVAHAISTINVQAGVAAHLADRRPDQVHDSLKAIRVASRDALDELGSILRLLRDTDRGAAPRAPAVRLDGVGDLVARVRGGGLAVIARVDGDLDAVPVAVSTAAYRVVQEGLTNVRRHAGLAAAAEVVVRVGVDRALVVEVVDDGGRTRPGEVRPAADVGAGLGLVGMRERVEATGGALEAGPAPAGGFRLRATWVGAS